MDGGPSAIPIEAFAPVSVQAEAGPMQQARRGCNSQPALLHTLNLPHGRDGGEKTGEAGRAVPVFGNVFNRRFQPGLQRFLTRSVDLRR